MRKKILATLSLCSSILVCNAVQAQLHKGNIFIGNNFTNIEINNNNIVNKFQLEIKPKIGYFFANNLALGLYSNLGFAKSGNQTFNTGGLGVFGRYYFNNIETPAISNFRFFGELNLGFIDNRHKINNIKYNNPCWQSGINLGGAYFISSNVSLELAIGYQISQAFDFNYTNHKMNLELGVQVYLPSSRVKDSYKELKGSIK